MSRLIQLLDAVFKATLQIHENDHFEPFAEKKYSLIEKQKMQNIFDAPLHQKASKVKAFSNRFQF